MGLEISEAMYAGLSKMDSTILQEAATDAEKFNDLLPKTIRSFSTSAIDADGLINSFVKEINSLTKERSDGNKKLENKNRGDVFSDLAVGISAVLQTRKDLGVGIPDQVFMTGNTWPSEVAPFRIPAFGMDDYNSSDLILKYGNLYYGISLKKKAYASAGSPTLINNAFSSFFKGSEFTKLTMEMVEAKTRFFARVIYDACTDNTPNSPFYVPEANDGKGGTILECNQVYQTKGTKNLVSEKYTISGMKLQSDGTLNIQDARKILDVRVDIWRKTGKGDWELKKNVKLLQLKDIKALARISNEFPTEFQTRFRDYVNKSLYAKNGKISELWTTFVGIMNDDRPRQGGRSIKQTMVDSLFTRILKIDLYKKLEEIKRNDFRFYLVTGAGRSLKPRGSEIFEPKVEQGTTKSLTSILANLAELCPDDCQKSIEFKEASETAAIVKLTLFVTPKGSSSKVPILDIGLRYGGDFSAFPRFEATITKEFIAYGKKKSK